jgi:hypothetical protein
VSKIRDISRSGWLLIGIVAAVVLIPTAAAAVTSTVIIKGGTLAGQAGVTGAHQLLTNGEIQGSSGNQANVNTTGQLLTNGEIQGTSGHQANVDGNGMLLTATSPRYASAGNNTEVGVFGSGYDVPLIIDPAGSATDDMISAIYIDVDQLVGGRSQILLLELPGTTCAPGGFQAVDSSSLGTTEITYPSALAITPGDVLCVEENITGADAIITAVGYVIPQGTVAGPMLRMSTLHVARH